MFISEVAFPHLMADRDARLAHELERRRVVDERRLEDSDAAPSTEARWAAAAGWAFPRPRRRPSASARCATC